MIYLFLGADWDAKNTKIAELKRKFLPSREALEFDYELLYAHKLDSEILQKALLALPAVVAQRVILIRDCDKLIPRNREIILEFAKQKEDKTVLLLDSDVLEARDSFVTALKSYAKVTDVHGQVPKNVFDMTREIGMRKPQEALSILFQLLSEGIHPLQIMGGIVWFWGKSRDRLPVERFKKGLTVMQEADLNIKRSRLPPEHALELLVVKLCTLV